MRAARGMNPFLARASGYDLANLWMNLAKVLILFLFIYQETLYTQLGLNMFKQIYYVFYLKEAGPSQATDSAAGGTNGADPDSSAPRQALTADNPRFNVAFLPLSISTHYDKVRVEILEVLREKASGRERLELNREAEWYREYAWPYDGRERETPLHLAVFDLRELVKQPLSSGIYKVRFGVRFYRDEKKVYEEGYEEKAEKLQPGADEHVVRLQYYQPSELRFGDFPVVHGQWFEVPLPLRSRQYTLAGWRTRDTQGGSAWSDWVPGTVIQPANGRFYPRRVSPGKTCEQRGYYEENENRIDFAVVFIVLENQAPRSTYLGPGEKDVYFVKLFSDYLFDGPGYQYFNLSQHIIDPDGKNAVGEADVRVRRMDDLRQSGRHFALGPAEDASSDFWLKVNGNIEQIIPRMGGTEEISVTAHDEVNNRSIKIRIVRVR